MTYHLAVDIGASSGRHILGWIENGIIKTEEVYRFENNLKKEDNKLIWDTDSLLKEVIEGIRQCKLAGKLPETVAIDTWGVDYALLDADLNVIKPVYCYRDSRTDRSIPEVEKLITKERMYELTGIQKQTYNTVYQLYADKMDGRLDNAKHFLLMPAFLSFGLTGKVLNEYTESSTMGMINANTKTWDWEIIDTLGFDRELFSELAMPCTEIGNFTDEVREYVGFDAKVVFCPSHDTASAVAACPLEKDSMYISSGTWSLIGMENTEAVLTMDAMNAGFSNEGGIGKTFRFLKNYMGMWLFQNIRRNVDKPMTYEETTRIAKECGEYEYIDVNASAFLAPDNMIDTIKNYLGQPDMPLGKVINSVYHSLAKSYADAVFEIEKLSGKSITAIHIVGGGCQDKYLNELTAEYTKKPVYAGPIEATATGNILAQIIYTNPDFTLEDARQMVRKSFNIVPVV